MYENASVIILTSGKATMKPEICGFLNESQLANEIIRLEINIFKIKLNICIIYQLKKFLILDIGFLSGS